MFVLLTSRWREQEFRAGEAVGPTYFHLSLHHESVPPWSKSFTGKYEGLYSVQKIQQIIALSNFHCSMHHVPPKTMGISPKTITSLQCLNCFLRDCLKRCLLSLSQSSWSSFPERLFITLTFQTVTYWCKWWFKKFILWLMFHNFLSDILQIAEMTSWRPSVIYNRDEWSIARLLRSILAQVYRWSVRKKSLKFHAEPTLEKKAISFWNNFLAIELWIVGIYCKPYSLFSHNIFGVIMLQIYFLLHHMLFSSFFPPCIICVFLRRPVRKMNNEWKQIINGWVQMRSIFWHSSTGITEQSTVGNDGDKVPASPETELGECIKSHHNIINCIVVCKKKKKKNPIFWSAWVKQNIVRLWGLSLEARLVLMVL